MNSAIIFLIAGLESDVFDGIRDHKVSDFDILGTNR